MSDDEGGRAPEAPTTPEAEEPRASTPSEEPGRRPTPWVPDIRLLRILWRMLAPLAVAANVVGLAWLLDAPADLKEQALVTAAFIAVFSLVASVVQELLSPSNADLRILPVRDHRAERLTAIVRGLLLVLLGTQLAIYLVEANEWSPSVAALLAVLRNVGLLLFAWAALSRSGILAQLTPESTRTYWQMTAWIFMRLLVPLGMLTLLFCAVAYALGYEALSQWVISRAAWTGVLVVGVGLAQRFLRRRVHTAITFIRDEQASEAEEEGEPEDEAPWWIGLERILGGTLSLGVVAAAWFGLLSIWSIEAADIGAFLAQPIFGGGTQTWGKLLGGLLKAGVVLLLLALVRNLLIFFVFPRTRVEVGARYAILTVLRYGAVVMVALFLLGAFGVDTGSLAIFAGAATFGLAFGMRDIFSNFFSGLIMLLERPVRVGDTIEVGGVRGKIEAIRLRGTTIRTFEGTSVIMPNTHLISERLTNISYGLTTARMQVDVGVSYGSDPREVERILLDVAHSDDRVIDDPAPVVRFQSFGDSSLDFTLRVWTRQVQDRWDLVHQLRVKVFEAFREHGVQIPFPQRDLHIRSDATRPAAAD